MMCIQPMCCGGGCRGETWLGIFTSSTQSLCCSDHSIDQRGWVSLSVLVDKNSCRMVFDQSHQLALLGKACCGHLSVLQFVVAGVLHDSSMDGAQRHSSQMCMPE